MPALESLNSRVPFSITRLPSDSGLGELGLAAAGLASSTDGANSQFGLPSALTSRTILGSTTVTELTSTLPPSSANSDGFTAIDFTSTMLGFLEPATFTNLTLDTPTDGVGSSDKVTGPSSTRSRPVAFFTCDTISGLYLLRSKNDGATRSATISTPTKPPPPIRSFLRVDGIMLFSGIRQNTSASAGGAA